MIGGVHTIFYSKNADALRAFFRDVLKFPSVDAGHGWLIFAAPPGEIAIHPAEERARHELFLMCADIKAEVARLEAMGVEFTMPITTERWGLLTQLKLPDGETLGLYEPRHPMAIKMSVTGRTGGKKASAKRKRARTRRAKRRK
ncbi:MAG: VOC family protein [Candidatus Acidiferrales bacterium]